jgi:lipopolysaccharide/colanic/teichoic acid biosynthesis glycosyltransferase
MHYSKALRERASRCLDILLASIGLVVLSPLMLLIAAAIVLEGGRTVFFAQTRLGQGGRHFRMYKFRKFRPSNGAGDLPLTLKNDARMTRVGRVLAVTKLDELPQLYNILMGDMAIVGPRPETLAFADCLSGAYGAVLDFKPGIFGPVQVAFRNENAFYPPQADPAQFYRETIFPLKADLDLSYYPRRTPRMDCVWIIRGVLAVLGLHPTMRELPAPSTAARARPPTLAPSASTTEFVVPNGATGLIG